MKEIDIVLLLGGVGARMGDLTKDRGKFMLDIDGKPTLLHVLDQIHEAFGSARVVLATGQFGDSLRSRFGNHYGPLELVYVHDSRHLETRRRIESVKDVVTDPFLVMGTDVLVHGSQLRKLAERYQACDDGNVLGAIAAADTHGPTHGHAVVEIRNGWVEEYLHHPPSKWPAHYLRDMHMYCFSKAYFAVSESTPADIVWVERVIMWARAHGHVFVGEPYKLRWYHFADPSDLNIKVDFQRDAIGRENQWSVSNI